LLMMNSFPSGDLAGFISILRTRLLRRAITRFDGTNTPGKRWFYEIARERFRMGRTEGSAAAAGAAVALANTTWARR